MANKITTAFASEICNSDRLEPRFYYNQNLLKKSFDSFGYQMIDAFSTLKSGSTPDHFDEKRDLDDCYFIKSADVKRYDLNFSTISFVTNQTHKYRKNSNIFPNDILLSNTGKYLGFACIVPENVTNASTNQNIIRIRFIDGADTKFDPFFILAFLNSLFGQIEIESLLTLTGQKYLNMEKFREFKIPLIDENLINKISSDTKLTIKNEIRSLKLIEEAKDYFYNQIGVDFSEIKKDKSYSVNITEFLKDDLWNPTFCYPLYVNTLKAIQKKWQTVKLGDIATFKKGNEVGSENYINYLEKKDSDVSFIRTSDLVNYELDQFPDFYIPLEIYNELKQEVSEGDIFYTKDGKIGMVAMLTKHDKIIYASGIMRLRLKAIARKYNLTPEYLFIVLSLKETGLYPAKRRTVVASTIPHLREDHLKNFEIPILDTISIDNITKLVKESFHLKSERKRLIKEIRKEIDRQFLL